MPLPLTVSCFSKIQIGFTFLVPTHPGSPGKRVVKRVCVCVCVCVTGSVWACLQLFICAGISVRIAKKELGSQWSQWSVEALWADSWVGFLGMGH